MNAAPYDVLLLDFGGVCLLNPVELHHVAESALGLPPGTFTWLGPVDPSTDPLYRELTMGSTLKEREYWARRAVDVGAAAGKQFQLPDYFALLYEPPRNELIRPDASLVAKRARDAGHGVSVLTNDLRSFHGPEWERGIEFFDLIDHLIDCSETDILKPDPRAYERAVEVVATDPSRILFVDDQRLSVEGAEKCGIDALWFDIGAPAQSWARVAEALELP